MSIPLPLFPPPQGREIEMSDTVEINLDLDPKLKTAIRKAAKASAMSVNEFICDTLESEVRRNLEYRNGENFVRHGGKHKHGKHTGYEVTDDGRYYPASCWADRFEQLFAERAAIHNLINGLLTTAQERLVLVEKQILKAKTELIDDLGLVLKSRGRITALSAALR